MTQSGQTVVECCVAAFPSSLGWMAVAWRGGRVYQLTFGHASQSAALGALGALTADGTLDARMRKLMKRLQQVADGVPDDLLDIDVDVTDRTAFQRAVIQHCRQIPRGEVCTYGQLAARAGSPRAARAVGRVMATNRVPLIVPCHRVIGADGHLHGFSAPHGLEMKRRLLRLEGAL